MATDGGHDQAPQALSDAEAREIAADVAWSMALSGRGITDADEAAIVERLTASREAPEKFVRGNDRLNRMLADPQTRREVDEVRAAMAQADEWEREERRGDDER